MKKYQQIFDITAIIAIGREKRPFVNEADLTCPFCLTHKAELEKVIDESWKEDERIVCIVPNRYPVPSEQGEKGIHDVIIDTVHHKKHPKDFTTEHWEMLMVQIQKRWQEIMTNSKINFIQLFKNYGSKAGASISHSHWQMIALEEIPYSMRQHYVHYNNQTSCYLCDAHHLEEGYLVGEDEWFEIWVPPIPQFPYEVWIIPKKHYQHYGELSIEEIKKLGKLMKYLLQVYHQLKLQYDFNICMISGDLKGAYPYHFYVKLVMRTGHIAGFEIATGCHIVPVAPQDYANQMKTILKGMYK